MFIDTHCHLEDENFSADRAEVLERAKLAGVNQIINFGSTHESSIAVTELAKNFSELFAGVGIHPEEIDGFDENSCERLAELAAEKKSCRCRRNRFGLSLGKKFRTAIDSAKNFYRAT